MVLLVALDHWKVDREEVIETPGFGAAGFTLGIPPPTPSGQGSSTVGETAPKKDENAFRYFLSKVVSAGSKGLNAHRSLQSDPPA